MLNGLMQDHPLLISSLIDYAERYHGDTEIVTYLGDHQCHRTTYAEAAARARKLANALSARGIGLGERVASMGWNTYRHFEMFFGVSGLGAVLHTVNPRLFEDQIRYVINHGGARLLFAEPDFLPILERLLPELPALEEVIVFCDAAQLPATRLPKVTDYESFIAPHSEQLIWPVFDENAASSICYTSGTTGEPKGAVYSHRSTVLHAMAAAHSSAMGINTTDVVMPLANMYHATAWGLPYICTMVGAKFVLPNRFADGDSVQFLIETEKVSFSGGVPTIWTMLFQHLDKTGTDIASLERVIIGGSAAPQSMIDRFRDRHDVRVLHIWGMTELSPIGTVASDTAKTAALPKDKRDEIMLKQGRVIYGCDLKITDDDGNILPHDGVASGALWARGPWVSRAYFGREDEPLLDADGWFPTGDVVTIDRYGFMRITDRAKDVIKSGGEWISSVDIENEVTGHPDVHMAAVVGVYHPKWEERPILIVVAKEGTAPTKDSILDYLSGRIAKWWMPDDVIFADEIPMTATGKIAKRTLRDTYKDHLAAS